MFLFSFLRHPVAKEPLSLSFIDFSESKFKGPNPSEASAGADHQGNGRERGTDSEGNAGNGGLEDEGEERNDS